MTLPKKIRPGTWVLILVLDETDPRRCAWCALFGKYYSEITDEFSCGNHLTNLVRDSRSWEDTYDAHEDDI